MDKFAFMKALRGADDLTHAEFRVLAMLVTWTDADLGNAHPGRDQLLEAACVSVPTGKKALRSLIEKGWVVLVDEGGNQHWKGKANVYRVTVPKGVTDLPPSDEGKGVSDLPPSSRGKGVNPSMEGGKPFSEGGKSVTPHQVLPSSPSTPGKNTRSSQALTGPSKPSATKLDPSWTPNTFHRSAATRYRIDVDEAARYFRDQMVGQYRADWDKAFGAYLAEAGASREQITFPMADEHEPTADVIDLPRRAPKGPRHA